MKSLSRMLAAAVVVGIGVLVLVAGTDPIATVTAAGDDTEESAVDVRGSDHSIVKSIGANRAGVSDAESVLASIREIEESMITRMDLSKKPSPSKTNTKAVIEKLPPLVSSGNPDGKLTEAVRWFEALRKDTQLPRGEIETIRGNMRKAGLDLITKECRQGICRLSFTYVIWHSARPPKAAAMILPDAWSFTTLAPDGRAEGHIFMKSPENS